VKIAYIYLIYWDKYKGPEQKIRERAAIASECGLDIDFYVLNRFDTKDEKNVKLIKIISRNILHLGYSLLFQKYALVEKSIDLKKYDYIVLRYFSADRSGVEFVRKYNVFLELHTDTISELQSNIRNEKFLGRKLVRLIRLILERKYNKKMVESCKGIIAVTDEIARKQLAGMSVLVPHIVLTNGINSERITRTAFKIFDGKTLDIVFIASYFFAYYGLDRVIDSIINYNGFVSINLHVVGKVPNALIEKYKKHTFIKYHGLKSTDESDAFFAGMSIAIGTMALFRNNMQEACSLKVREYIAKGIPFILAYKDPDLDEVDEKFKFFLEFENSDSLIDIQKVVDFAIEVSKRSNKISDYMRNYAREKLDLSVRMKTMVEFVENIAKKEISKI
jgi:hypothetical protein